MHGIYIVPVSVCCTRTIINLVLRIVKSGSERRKECDCTKYSGYFKIFKEYRKNSTEKQSDENPSLAVLVISITSTSALTTPIHMKLNL